MQPISIQINFEPEKPVEPAGVVMAPHTVIRPNRSNFRKMLREELQSNRETMKPVIESTVAEAVNPINSTLNSLSTAMNGNKKTKRKKRLLPSDEGVSISKRSIFRETDGNGYFEV